MDSDEKSMMDWLQGGRMCQEQQFGRDILNGFYFMYVHVCMSLHSCKWWYLHVFFFSFLCILLNPVQFLLQVKHSCGETSPTC